MIKICSNIQFQEYVKEKNLEDIVAIYIENYDKKLDSIELNHNILFLRFNTIEDPEFYIKNDLFSENQANTIIDFSFKYFDTFISNTDVAYISSPNGICRSSTIAAAIYNILNVSDEFIFNSYTYLLDRYVYELILNKLDKKITPNVLSAKFAKNAFLFEITHFKKDFD